MVLLCTYCSERPFEAEQERLDRTSIQYFLFSDHLPHFLFPRQPSFLLISFTSIMVEEVSQPVSCTFSDCKQIFWNMGDMITHKINLKCHSYCLPCDLDFPSEQALYLHMITSNGHITCIHCGLEFRSQGGLGVHIQNVSLMHQSTAIARAFL